MFDERLPLRRELTLRSRRRLYWLTRRALYRLLLPVALDGDRRFMASNTAGNSAENAVMRCVTCDRADSGSGQTPDSLRLHRHRSSSN